MKKIVSLILAALMLFSASFALAEEALSASGYASDLVITQTKGDEVVHSVDLTGLTLTEKTLSGQYGAEEVYTLSYNGKNILNVMGQLTESGQLYISAEGLSKVYCFDLSAISGELITAVSEMLKEYFRGITEDEESLEHLMISVRDAIVEIGASMLETAVEAAETAITVVDKIIENTDVSVEFGKKEKAFGEANVECSVMDILLTFKEPVALGNTKVKTLGFSVYVDAAEVPTCMAIGMSAGSESKELYDGELRLFAPEGNSYAVDLTCCGETVLTGTYTEQENGSFNFDLKGGFMEVTASNEETKTETGASNTVKAAVSVAGTDLIVLNGFYEVGTENISISADVAFGTEISASALYTGTFAGSEKGMQTDGTASVEFVNEDEKLAATAKLGVSLSAADETTDLSTGDLYKVNSILGLGAFFSDEAVASDVMGLFFSVVNELSEIPAVSNLLAAAADAVSAA